MKIRGRFDAVGEGQDWQISKKLLILLILLRKKVLSYFTMHIFKWKSKLKVEDYNLLSTLGKQPPFNIVSRSKHNIETTSDSF